MGMDDAKQCEGETQEHIGRLAIDYNRYVDARTTSVLDRGHFSTVAAETVSMVS